MKKDKVEETIEVLEQWLRTDMVKATETYKHWQHDKNSYAYGYIMGIKSAISQLRQK